MRPRRDGVLDAIGRYRVGSETTYITFDCALEAKCYAMTNSVGVRQTSRLISRLRHRQFGVLVTTSFVDLQAYKELREDGHPVVIISARDIVEILANHGLGTVAEVGDWLTREFPMPTEERREPIEPQVAQHTPGAIR